MLTLGRRKKVNHETSVASLPPLETQCTADASPEVSESSNYQVQECRIPSPVASVDHGSALARNHGTSLNATDGVTAISGQLSDKVAEVTSFGPTPSLSSGCSPQAALHATVLNAPPVDLVLPAFIQPIPDHLAPEDVDYLRKKGCFDVPEPELRDAILRSYAEYVHPCIPLLDLARFLSSILSPQPQGNRISLLLFQAVMFAGSAHVDIKPLRKLGYLRRKAARRALYLKTKVCRLHIWTLFSRADSQDRLFTTLTTNRTEHLSSKPFPLLCRTGLRLQTIRRTPVTGYRLHGH